MSETKRLELPTGVSLAVSTYGDRASPPLILLHGFPESHRTWRKVAPALAEDHFVVVPDQRGFAGSDKPEGVDSYRIEHILGDLFELADALSLDRFALAGHDWGGAVAWAAALARPDRIEKLVIVNAPHPLVFQKSLFSDEPQRLASQYISAFRDPAIEQRLQAMGLETFLDKSFAAHAPPGAIPEEEKRLYLEQWAQPGALAAMLNWYRASAIVVPRPGEDAPLPAWTQAPFPKIEMPVLVAWGMRDKALLPIQLDGLEEHVRDLTIVRVEDAGHFLPWERPEPLVAAMRAFLRD